LWLLRGGGRAGAGRAGAVINDDETNVGTALVVAVVTVEEVVANVDDNGDTVLQTFLELVTEAVETVTDSGDTGFDTVHNLLDAVLELASEHDEGELDLVNGPTEDTAHEVEGTSNEVSGFDDGKTDGGTNDDGDGDGELDDGKTGVEGELEEVLSEVQVGQVAGPEASATELGLKRVDLVGDPTATDLTAVGGVQGTGDDEDLLTVTDHGSDLNETESALNTTGHEGVADEVHDVVVQLQSLLVTEMGGGVHAGAEVRGVELAANLDLGTDGQTGMSTVAELEIGFTTESDFSGEGAETTGNVETGGDFAVTGATTSSEAATDGTGFSTKFESGTDILRAGKSGRGSDGGSSEIEGTMHDMCMRERESVSVVRYRAV
jgi:hypothetical protein